MDNCVHILVAQHSKFEKMWTDTERVTEPELSSARPCSHKTETEIRHVIAIDQSRDLFTGVEVHGR